MCAMPDARAQTLRPPPQPKWLKLKTLKSIPLEMFIQNHLIVTKKQSRALRRCRCQRQQFIWFEYSDRIENFTYFGWKNNEQNRSLVGIVAIGIVRLYRCRLASRWCPTNAWSTRKTSQTIEHKQESYSSPERMRCRPTYRRRLSLRTWVRQDCVDDDDRTT